MCMCVRDFRNSRMMGRGGRCRKGSIFSPLNRAGTFGCLKTKLPRAEVQSFQLGARSHSAGAALGPWGTGRFQQWPRRCPSPSSSRVASAPSTAEASRMQAQGRSGPAPRAQSAGASAPRGSSAPCPGKARRRDEGLPPAAPGGATATGRQQGAHVAPGGSTS